MHSILASRIDSCHRLREAAEQQWTDCHSRSSLGCPSCNGSQQANANARQRSCACILGLSRHHLQGQQFGHIRSVSTNRFPMTNAIRRQAGRAGATAENAPALNSPVAGDANIGRYRSEDGRDQYPDARRTSYSNALSNGCNINPMIPLKQSGSVLAFLQFQSV